MRRLMYSVAMSLDGYIAGPNGEFDWIPDDKSIDWNAFMSRFDTVLMGRRTFEVVVEHGSDAGLPDMRTYVFSRTLHTRLSLTQSKTYPSGITLLNFDVPMT